MKLFYLAAALLVSTPALANSPLIGNWTNPSANIVVRIGPCGGGSLCGRVVSASSHAREKAAEGGTDQLVGTTLMNDIEQTGPGTWHADVFIPDHDIHADGEIELDSPGQMSVKGCAMGGLLCRSQTWTRVSAPAHRRR